MDRRLLFGLCLIGCADPKIDPNLSPTDLVLPTGPAPIEPTLPDGIKVRVATFNLHGGQDASADSIGGFLATLDLDLVALEECPTDLGEAVAAAAGFQYALGEGQMLLSHSPLVDFEHIDVFTRSFSRAKVDIDGVTFTFYGAHLGWNAEGYTQCKEFIQTHVANDPNPYVLIVGDFNDEHYSAQISLFDSILEDAATKVGWYPGQRISWPATGFDGGEGSQLIDLIFFRRELGVIVTKLDVVNTPFPLSDHKPAWAELLFPRQATAPFPSDPYSELRKIPAPAAEPANRLTNPGAEDGLTGWQVGDGAKAETEREAHGPAAGARFFTGSTDPMLEPAISTLEQTVDLSAESALIDAGRGRLWAKAMLTTGFHTEDADGVSVNTVRPYDDGEIVVRALDADGRELQVSSSGRRDTLAYHPYRAILEVPPGTRRARYSFLSHRKALNGSSNDAIADELFLGFFEDEPSPRLGGNLLRELGDDVLESSQVPWSLSGFRRHLDLVGLGLMIYPPWTHSGVAHYVAGEDFAENPTTGARMSQELDWSAYADLQDGGELALRWGGWLRTYAAKTTLRIELEIEDQDGSVWGVISGPDIGAPEWTHVELLTRIPKGAKGARFRVMGDVPVEEWIFADDLYAYPERVSPPGTGS